MPDRVLVAMDGSAPSKQALEHALSEYPGASVTVLHVVNPMEAGYSADPMGGDVWEGWYENAVEISDDLFAEATSIAEEHGVAIETVRETGRPAQVIVAYAADHDVDLVIVGSRGRSGVSRLLLGSVAETVVRRSPVPVTVVR